MARRRDETAMNEENKEVPNPGEPVAITGQQVLWKDIQYPTLYANVFTVSVTPVDVSIILGELDSANATNVIATPRIKLTVTPEFAATIIAGLAKGVNLFANSNGALRANAPRVPPEEEFVKR